MASNGKPRTGSPKRRSRFRSRGAHSEFNSYDADDIRGVDLGRRSGGLTKERGNSPRNPARKKQSEIRANQRDAKTVDRGASFQMGEDDIFDTNIVIGSPNQKGNNSLVMFGSSRPLRCLSTSCVSEKDFVEDPEKLESKGQRKPKKKFKSRSQKPSPADQLRSRYINRLKQVINAGNSRQNQAETDRKIDQKRQKYQLCSTEIIWLELQAWFNDRNLQEQDLILFNARQLLVKKILSFISIFEFNSKCVDFIQELDTQIECTLLNMTCDSFISIGGFDESLESKNEDDCLDLKITPNQNSENILTLPYEETTLSPAKSSLFILLPSDEYLQSQKNALKNVGEVLGLVCIIEGLYPSSSKLAAEHLHYKESKFQSKLESLCCWYNITTDLRYKFTSFLHLIMVSSSASDSQYEEYNNIDSDLNDTDAIERIGHGSRIDALPNFNEINADQLIYDHTDRILKQKPVKAILQGFIRRVFTSLFKAKMNLMLESCYEPLKSSHSSQQGDKCASCAVSDAIDQTKETTHCYMCYYRLKDSVKVTQTQKLCALLQKIEKVLSSTDNVIADERSDVILENSTAVIDSNSRTSVFGLPCLKPIYLSFPSTLFALIKQCMHLRMKQTMPFFCNNNNSGIELLTAKQLVLKSKEMLECALLARDITIFFYEDVADREQYMNMLAAFAAYEKDLHCVVSTYLDFVDTWLVRMQKDLPHVPRGFHEILEMEWTFSCQIMSQIGFDTLILSAKRFIKISAEIVNSTSDFLKTAIRELVQPLTDGTTSMKELLIPSKDISSPLSPDSLYSNGTSESSSNLSTMQGIRNGHRGKAGVLWYQHQRSESPHLSRHDSSQSTESTLDSPVDYNRQTSSASNSSASSFPWNSYRSTSYLGHQKRHLFEVCRAVRDLFNETRERAIKILHFGKRLRKTLEPAIGYKMVHPDPQNIQGQHCCPYCQLIDALDSEGYIHVDMSELLLKLESKFKLDENENADAETHLDFSNYWMFIPRPEGSDCDDIDADMAWCMIRKTLLDHIKRAYLDDNLCDDDNHACISCVVLVKKPIETHGARRQSEVVIPNRKKGRNNRSQKSVTPSFSGWNKTQSENNLLDHIRDTTPRKCSTWYGKAVCIYDEAIVETMKLISENFDVTHDITVISASADDVGVVRKEFSMLSQTVTKVSLAQMPIIKGVKPAFHDFREKVLDLCNSLMECIDFILGHLESQMDKLVQQRISRNNSTDIDTRRQIKSEVNEVMQSCFNFSFDFVKEATRIMSGEFRDKMTELHMNIATQWMEYVLKHRCKGKGNRPRWATQGLNFLVAIDMSYWYSVSDERFTNIKGKIDSFINHLIGDSSEKHNDKDDLCGANQSKSFGSLRLPDQEKQILRSLSNPSTTDTAPHSPVSIDEEPEKMEDIGQMDEEYSPIEHIRNAIVDMEADNDMKKREAGIIGRISDAQQHIPIINLGVRTVNFRWQRGARVGEGAFGQVYTCVNVDTGTVLAMKEVKFHPNDHKRIRAAIDEYTNFEGIRHPHLVRYYGVELHRDEMYIFMEYCDSGTLGDMCKISLPEVMVRRYTSQILSAIHVLHSRGIVHRDIKGSNIFLTSSGAIKVGDFGSAVKLKNTARTTPGEMVSHIGTTLPYAAPEVVNASENIGYGRASDMWSMGCVVIEMSSGKQPWQGLEIVQVMFRVGNGEAPAIPDSLSQEGIDFIKMCTVPDPRKRWTAEKLLGHSFVKILDVDEAL